jgi:ABC-type phosphonate transport system ATPase subunit
MSIHRLSQKYSATKNFNVASIDVTVTGDILVVAGGGGSGSTQGAAGGGGQVLPSNGVYFIKNVYSKINSFKKI